MISFSLLHVVQSKVGYFLLDRTTMASSEPTLRPRQTVQLLFNCLLAFQSSNSLVVEITTCYLQQMVKFFPSAGASEANSVSTRPWTSSYLFL